MEEQHMTKSEAKASIREMGRMMDYFDSPCEYCKELNKDCSCMKGE